MAKGSGRKAQGNCDTSKTGETRKRDQSSEVDGQKTDDRVQKIDLDSFNDFNGLNDFAGGERLNPPASAEALRWRAGDLNDM